MNLTPLAIARNKIDFPEPFSLIKKTSAELSPQQGVFCNTGRTKAK
ncbi:MAG: hypothetical protein ONB31_05275 [candidate division KSB1 bacterium]|nr:hypothetical protein [candidate division KSB1 bacterium]MDZ7357114.1 hypothetical protein [candidate division KSB1 bacterium]